MRKQKIIKFACGVLIFILVLIFIQIKRKNYISKGQLYQSIITAELPEFNSLDINGIPVKKGDFNGRNLYVQFVDPLNIDDIDLIERVYSYWQNENVVILVITNNLEKFKQKSKINLKNIIVINKDYEEMKSKFNSPPHQGTYYLFNSKGKMVNIGRSSTRYENGIKVFLNQLVKNKYFSISDFIKVNKSIKNIEWFKFLTGIVEKDEKNYFIISMFTSVCDTCIEGSIIRSLKRIHSESQETISVLCILNHNFNEKDINNLKSQLAINFPVIIADSILNQKWSSLVEEFGESYLTNIVFIADKSGKILKVLDRSCDCAKPFFSYVYSLIKM